jgi:protein-disulfide isomerase
VANRQAVARQRSNAATRSAAPAGRGRHPLLVPSLLALGAGMIGVFVLALAIGMSGSDPIRIPEAAPPVALADGQALGSPDAPVTIEIWSDFQCPACGMLAREIEPRLIADYVVPGHVRLVYRDLAFLGNESTLAAIGGRYAAEQNRFWNYHDIVFANQKGENEGAFRRERLADIAAAAGLERADFERALGRSDLRAEVTDDVAAGTELGVTSTPTLVINGTVCRGVPDYQALASLLDSLATH